MWIVVGIIVFAVCSFGIYLAIIEEELRENKEHNDTENDY